MIPLHIKHLIYKEWIKTRWYATLGLLLTFALSVYMAINTAMTFHHMDSAMYYSMLMTGNISLFTALKFKYWALLVALLIGLPQFLPEISHKRIRLTLHLPVGATTIVYSMVLYGLMLCFAVLLPALLVVLVTLVAMFPMEIVVPTLQTMLPWLLGGITGYFFIAMIAFEPIAKFRFLYIIGAYFILRFFYISYGVGNAVTVYPLLLVITIVAGLSVLYTSHRFNKGAR